MTEKKVVIVSYSIPNPNATMPADEPYKPCKSCGGSGTSPKDDSKHCEVCRGTGDARHVSIGGVWRGTYPQKSTKRELRLARQVTFWMVAILLVLIALAVRVIYVFLTAGF